MLASQTANAIKGAKDSANDPRAAAVLSSIETSTGDMPTRQDMQLAVDASKPRPMPNLAASTAAEVYPLKVLMGEDMLRHMPVKEWQDAVADGRDVSTHSRFVSKRLVQVVKSKNIAQLRALRFILVLLAYHRALQGKAVIKKLPKREELVKAMECTDTIVQGVVRRFADGA